ncbi:MAG: potassium-transporting ATPase subunit KdpC [Magnetococcales bacterium]|nr:potassium-transporting ATPase subunit KdpC [Magnetococcales bacterium]MBF0114325.1 potassium-transporting ATPase subunit KdpC [Magnetococcales bacterium]
MLKELKPALLMLTLMTLLTGALYPALVTALAHWLFPWQAAGSLLTVKGEVVGSELVGQSFSEPRYFWGRPSATAPMSHNGAASAATNLGPLNPTLTETIRARMQTLQESDPGQSAPIPVDLVTSSASGLDPHISVAAALWQLPRVARTRGLSEQTVLHLLQQHTQERTWGILGERRVNVLTLNLALDQRTQP